MDFTVAFEVDADSFVEQLMIAFHCSLFGTTLPDQLSLDVFVDVSGWAVRCARRVLLFEVY